MDKMCLILVVSFLPILLGHPSNNETNISDFFPEEQNGRWCHCWNTTEVEFDEIECRCFGKLLVRIPRNLPQLKKLTVMDAGVRILTTNSFQPYSNSLEDITLSNLQKLEVIEAGTLKNLDNLRSLYISHAPLLKKLPMLFEGVTTTKFLSLRIMHTGLEEVPDLSKLNQSKIIHMIDLEDNNFHVLPSNSIKIQADQVILNYNKITEVLSHAFSGSQIAKLSLKGNRKLTFLHEETFSGLKSLTELDLSGTSIENLPVKGLDEIEILKIQDTKSLKVIPSVYNFNFILNWVWMKRHKRRVTAVEMRYSPGDKIVFGIRWCMMNARLNQLKEAWLTHSFHCCAFNYPAQHDPIQHAIHEAKLKKLCELLGVSPHIYSPQKVKRTVDTSWSNEPINKQSSIGDFLQFDAPIFNQNFSSIRGENLGKIKNSIEYSKMEDTGGTFHSPVSISNEKSIFALCGNISISTNKISCFPKPDALNPCEDIMGSNWLRISVWFVVISAVIGNLAVVIVFFSSIFDINVPKFLMCHLAVSDFCMGFYLLLIASMDLHSMGFYFNYAYDWQIGNGCQVAGFLTVFASQLSVFTLTIITLERWFAIRFAIYLNRRIKLKAAAKIMTVGWLYSILMASLPLFGISNYSSTSICLPMEIKDPKDIGYLVSLLLINGLAFLIIVICYSQIYLSLGQETRRCSSNNEMTIAKKMAMLVFTDFACWAPIAFFGLTALAGYPLIDVTRSKILLVFFYPLNSCANPYLYAILTAQYRRDFFMLLYRCGICKSRVRRYTTTTSVQNSNPSNPLSLLGRANGRKLSRSTNLLDDALV